MSSHHVVTGAEAMARQGWRPLLGQRVGVVTNPTGVLADLTSIVDDMHAQGVNLVAVFGPEHGFRGSAQDGSSEGTQIDRRTGITVHDTYGATPEQLADTLSRARVETLVFDIQDAGARFYTYIWTMYTAMLAAAQAGARFVVLDRPNPLGGQVRGPIMAPGFESFVGMRPIVQQHGMSIGELARLLAAEFVPDRLELEVIEVEGWSPTMRYADTGLAWVPPSPNLPTPDTALLYPGTGLFEGTNLSEGRGTTRPFELIGAPFVDQRWAAALNRRCLPGVRFREVTFTPQFGKHQGQVCCGVQVHLTDPSRLEAITVAVEMLVSLRSLYPEFAWRDDHWIDKLSGSQRLRTQVDSGATAPEIVGNWQDELAQFAATHEQYLLYDRVSASATSAPPRPDR